MESFDDNMYFDALRFATEAHKGQKRKGTNVEYISHPLRVALIFMRYSYFINNDSKYTINELVAVCLLHDVLEDCLVSKEDILKKFGKNVLGLILELTSNKEEIKRIGKNEYLYQKFLNMSIEAKIIKLCDRLANITDTPTFKYVDDTLILMEKVFMFNNMNNSFLNVLVNNISNECHKFIRKLVCNQMEKVT